MAFAIWGVRSGDPMTMAGVPVGLPVVAALAILVPARKTTRIDPMVALRAE
jgi:putative ABC transport system permease protein